MKSKSAGQFGYKYGKKIRDKIIEVKRKSKKKYMCPACSRRAVRRVAAGVWICKKCGKKFASGAFEFRE